MGIASRASYLNKYLVNHVSGKGLNENILQEKSVLSNIKSAQI